MKKNKFLSLLLALLTVVSCIPLRTMASAVLENDVLEWVTEPLPDGSEEAPQTEYAFGSVSILNGCRTLEAQVPLAGSDRKLNTAQSVLVYERDTGTMIYSYNPDMKMAPGSLSKLLTALIVIERCDNLDQTITVGAGIAGRIPGGAQNIKLKSDEELTIRDLLNCMILQNAADAAVALSEYVAGNQKAFVELMNQRAKQIGCTNTVFGNVHGFDNVQQYTTARDMARIVMEATKNETFCELFANQAYTVPATNVSEERKFASQNYLMETTIVPKYNDRRVTGGMASYAPTSGAGIVCTADNSTEKKKGLNIICVLLGATREFGSNGWTVTNYGNFDEMVQLLEFVYNHYKVNRVIYEGQALEQFPVAGGESDVVGIPHVNIDSVLPAEAQMTNLVRNRTVKNGGLTAPIAEDEMIGSIELWYRNSCLMEAELFSMSEVRSTTNSGLKVYGVKNSGDSTEAKASRYVLIGSAIVLVPVLAYLGYNSYMRNRIRNQRRRRRQGRRRSY